MPTEIFFPFSLAADGGIATTTDPDVIALQHVESLVATSQGERVMLPTYGVSPAQYVFGNGADEVIAGLTTDVEEQMSYWEPSLTVLQVLPVIDDTSNGIAEINVEFSQQQNTDTATNTATVLVGGLVIESVVSNAT